MVKQANKNDNAEREKTKEKRKSSKLVQLNIPNATNMHSQIINETNTVETVIQMKTNAKRRKIK